MIWIDPRKKSHKDWMGKIRKVWLMVEKEREGLVRYVRSGRAKQGYLDKVNHNNKLILDFAAASLDMMLEAEESQEILVKDMLVMSEEIERLKLENKICKNLLEGLCGYDTSLIKTFRKSELEIF